MGESALAPAGERADTRRTMRTRRPTLLQHLLAITFTLVLPVASAHCVTMSLLAASAPKSPATTLASTDAASPMRADHSCCVSGAAARTRGVPSPDTSTDCACAGLPTGTAPVQFSLIAPDVVASLTIMSALLAPPAHTSLPRAPRWSDPPPVAPAIGGLSLRGPPAQG